MKVRSFFATLIFVVAFANLLSNAQTTGTTFPSNADMTAYAANNSVVIDFTNPDMENLTFVISDFHGNVLEVNRTSEFSGQITYSGPALVSGGGTNIYKVDLYSGDGKKKVEGAVVVIIIE